MMKQAQQLQGKMAEAQEKVAKIECEGSSGGGMISLTLGGKHELKNLKIDKSIMEDGDVEMIEDLIVAAYHDAKKKLDKESEDLMKDATGGINIPGLQLPF